MFVCFSFSLAWGSSPWVDRDQSDLNGPPSRHPLPLCHGDGPSPGPCHCGVSVWCHRDGPRHMTLSVPQAARAKLEHLLQLKEAAKLQLPVHWLSSVQLTYTTSSYL